MKRNLTRLSALTFCVGLTTTNIGCATKVLLVPNGTPVRLAEPVKARIFVPDSTGKVIESQNRVTIPAGWYALPKD
jgi:hypothetical protein